MLHRTQECARKSSGSYILKQQDLALCHGMPQPVNLPALLEKDNMLSRRLHTIWLSAYPGTRLVVNEACTMLLRRSGVTVGCCGRCNHRRASSSGSFNAGPCTDSSALRTAGSTSDCTQSNLALPFPPFWPPRQAKHCTCTNVAPRVMVQHASVVV
jgi:hypothetical protein